MEYFTGDMVQFKIDRSHYLHHLNGIYAKVVGKDFDGNITVWSPEFCGDENFTIHSSFVRKVERHEIQDRIFTLREQIRNLERL